MKTKKNKPNHLHLKGTALFLFLNFFGSFPNALLSQNNTFPETGNVGIGTEEPRSNLHVKGNVLIESDLTIENMSTEMIDPKKVTYFLTLDRNGKIVAKGMGNLPLLDPAPLTICDLASPDGGAYFSQHPQWFSEPNKIYVPCPDVFVGIGTFNPRTHLDVIGTTYSKKLYLGLADPLLGTSFNSPLFHLKANYSASLANQTVFIVENNTRKLFQIENNGMVRAREIKVDLANNWPDYVFQPSYPLMPLMEVKTYVEANGHLPNVPDACEVEEEGIALGEMNRILLEKVEELTLYMIQMQEEQERLKLELEELKTKNLGQ